MAIRFQTNDFSSEQLEHLDVLISCAQELVSALLIKPDYLAHEPIVSEDETMDCGIATDVLVRVAEYLSEEGFNCFLPTHVVSEASGFPVEFISDTFATPVMLEDENIGAST